MHGGADRLAANDEPLWIGAVRGVRGDVLEPFDGILDHVAIYPRALDAAEIEALRAGGAGREAR